MVARAIMRIVVAIAYLCFASAAQPTKWKRGFVGFVGSGASLGTCLDATALNLADSWFYNWQSAPYAQEDSCRSHPQAAEFVPMVNRIHGQNSLDELLIGWNSTLQMWRDANVNYLLGFNEPDYGNGDNHPSMCTPAEAAVAWPKMQEIASNFNPPLSLVAPAISTSGPDAWDANGASVWLDEFFGNCSEVVDCDLASIPYIAMHDHGNDVAMLEKKINGAAERYKRKVWLTEFNIMEWGKANNTASREEQDQFLSEALLMPDAHSAVYRYSWVSARGCPNAMNGGSNLLPCDNLSMDLTSTGKIYAQQGAQSLV
jgi:hypothetical protein